MVYISKTYVQGEGGREELYQTELCVCHLILLFFLAHHCNNIMVTLQYSVKYLVVAFLLNMRYSTHI
jgi:hypothetical protein